MANDEIPKLTPSRRTVLEYVRAGRIYTFWPMNAKPPVWMIGPGPEEGMTYGKKANRATCLWLRDQGLIRADTGKVRTTPYVLTELGKRTLGEVS